MSSPTTQQAKGNWKQFKGRLQEAWGVLTDDELEQYEGKRARLEGYIQEKSGERRKAIREKIDEISKKVKYHF